MKKLSSFLVLGIIVFLLVSVYTGYLYAKKLSLADDLAGTDKILTEVKTEVLKYQDNDVKQAISAKQTYSELSASIIEWSKIIKAIRKTIPTDKNNNPVIEILSYSGSANNEISMSVKTSPDSENPYLDAATLIEAFTKSVNFTDSFLPSISKGKDTEGQKVLSFMFSTKYVEEEIDPVSEETPSLEETVLEVVTPEEDGGGLSR